MAEPSTWHLDKRVPIALIAALLTQTVGIVAWAVRLDARVDDHERRIVRVEASDTTQGALFSVINERLARIDERLLVLIEHARKDR